jgi:hypothetical protein
LLLHTGLTVGVVLGVFVGVVLGAVAAVALVVIFGVGVYVGVGIIEGVVNDLQLSVGSSKLRFFIFIGTTESTSTDGSQSVEAGRADGTFVLYTVSVVFGRQFLFG